MNKRVKAKYVKDHQKAWNKHTGKPMGKGEFIKWTDISTSRSETAVENLFGESIQRTTSICCRIRCAAGR